MKQRLCLLQGIARTQFGLFTYAQAISVDIPPRTIAWMLDRGRWQEVEPGVMRALPAGRLTWQERIFALSSTGNSDTWTLPGPNLSSTWNSMGSFRTWSVPSSTRIGCDRTRWWRQGGPSFG